MPSAQYHILTRSPTTELTKVSLPRSMHTWGVGSRSIHQLKMYTLTISNMLFTIFCLEIKNILQIYHRIQRQKAPTILYFWIAAKHKPFTYLSNHPYVFSFLTSKFNVY